MVARFAIACVFAVRRSVVAGNNERGRGAPLCRRQAVRLQLLRRHPRRRPHLRRRLGHRQRPVRRQGAGQGGVDAGGNLAGQGPGGLRVAQGHAVRAVLQSQPDGRQELPRLGGGHGFRLLRAHPPRCERRRAGSAADASRSQPLPLHPATFAPRGGESALTSQSVRHRNCRRCGRARHEDASLSIVAASAARSSALESLRARAIGEATSSRSR